MGYNPREKLIETRLSAVDLKAKLWRILGGGKRRKYVVWTSGENEVVVELSQLEVVLLSGRILVELHMNCDEFGPQQLILPFNLGSTPENSYLLAVMPKLFGGHQGLARTWGKVAAKFVWQACLDAMQVKWQDDKGLDDFRLQGFVGREGMVQGLFAYPITGGIREADVEPASLKDVLEPLEVTQIRLGIKTKGAELVKLLALLKFRAKDLRLRGSGVLDINVHVGERPRGEREVIIPRERERELENHNLGGGRKPIRRPKKPKPKPKPRVRGTSQLKLAKPKPKPKVRGTSQLKPAKPKPKPKVRGTSQLKPAKPKPKPKPRNQRKKVRKPRR